MNEQITEHISHDKGYSEGFQAAKKQAWDVLEKLANYYNNQSMNPWSVDNDDSYVVNQAKWKAILHAQMEIKRDV